MTLPATVGDWFVPISGTSAAPLRMLAFPHAGAGVSSFASWRRRFDERIEVLGARLPGRETRIDEEPLDDFDLLLEKVVGVVLDSFVEKPLVLFGHCLGSLVAFALARELEQREMPVRLLCVSSQAPPRAEASTFSDVALSEDSVVVHLEQLGGTNPALLRDPEFLELVLPAIRADFAVAASFRYRPGRPLSTPILAVAGENERHVSEEGLEAWQELTTGRVVTEVRPGGHFPSGPEWLLTADLLEREVERISEVG